jgi:hypothetical protein
LYADLRNDANEVRRLLNGYIDWLKAKKLGEKDPGAQLAVRESPVGYLIELEPEDLDPS